MFFRTSAATAALALSVASLFGSAAAVTCAVCPSSIFYAGLTRSLTFTLQSGGGSTVQCNYGSPPISGFSPYCLYGNSNGALILTNTGGSCPSPVSLTSRITC
ncbi:hypothetical protein FPV67DRAFT_1496002 [Lyophyllum atratum]|nr:hypothetical protein FPV67DRAFT_1496002 [Lyophyllum atratum]